MVSWEPEHHIRVVMSRQRWRDVAFVHWPVRPEALRPHLPPGLTVDTYDGVAWVGLTPFTITATPGPLWPTRLGLTGAEANLRTYVRDADGTDGLAFLTLETTSALLVTAARLALGLSYRRSSAEVRRDDTAISYRFNRRGGPHLSLRVETGEASSPGPLETFLLGRWRAVTSWPAGVWWVPVRHQPWPLVRAELTDPDETFLDHFGLVPESRTPHVTFSPGVDSTFGLPQRGAGGAGRPLLARTR